MSFFIIYLTYILILLSLLSQWFKRYNKTGNILFFISLALAFISGIINFIGILIVTLSAILIYLSSKQKSKKIIAIPIFVITALFLLFNYMHILPGFNNICIIKNAHISLDAIPFTLYLNYNSLILTYLILIVFSPKIKLLNSSNEILSTIKLGCLYGLVAILILLPISYIFSFIKYDFKVTNYTLIFIFVNLLFTCIPEEILWRGFVQTKIQKYTNSIVSVLITSLIFASIHIIFAGISFAVLAFIASIIYGLAYIKTKRIEVSIICHYLVNVGQFIFFTYPILTSAYPN
ncbi:CPBP family intramembrane glutamic endopeptidase [Francisella sp. LA112445]|uniref:CPBP family intramembrane glutamic endopeptidase n=1 Tax=Francisella sp. LA112445 TaxID=1395624 RepID=UPI001788E1F7|nr:CPBP family intramembrane glutamic endopeptidase [Francisella sp. LA112445]QIW09298.1 CPBP family intramembrane metalloprotease [Francisella sp. LA112445]